MATSTDNTAQSDINKMKAEKDGSFKRADASFRNIVERGGRFEPQLGAGKLLYVVGIMTMIFAISDRYHLYVSYACRERS
jgi:putative glutathione S-transferase